MSNHPVDPSSDDIPTQPYSSGDFQTSGKQRQTPDEYQTQPFYPVQRMDAVERLQAIRVRPSKQPRSRPPAARRNCFGSGCLPVGCLSFLLGLALVMVYFLAPLRTNLLILGIDRTPEGTVTGRSDTMILVSVVPLQPVVNLLSIPRDLWVNIAGVGEQRINTAHFFAEAQEPGSGPEAALQAVQDNFQVKVPYYVRVRFDSFAQIVDAMGGVTIDLPEDMSGYAAGENHLTSEQALAFVRDRKGSDDFFRMSRGQLLIRGVLQQMLVPFTWLRFPAIVQALNASMDTNLPLWQWPRLALALVRTGGSGINSRTVDREMVTPFVTSGGADVLLPNWDQILPLTTEMFGP